jgi:aspartate 1-decarboxylase
MQRTFLRAKLHQATVTSADLHYEGSISLDRALCREAGLLGFEQVDVYNITNGARFTTYVIPGEPGQVQLNGAAARLVQPGDRIIVAAYASLSEDEIARHAPRIVLLDERNRVLSAFSGCLTSP